VGSVEESLALILQALSNTPGPARDIVTLNAGVALYVADLASTLAEGVQKAREVIANGAARERLAHLVRMSRACAEKSS